MIPEGKIETADLQEEMPSLTYRMSAQKQEVRGTLDGLDAVRQAIEKILQTERYRYVIYDWNYGVEFEDLFGKPVSYVIPELERRITEALLTDDRIEQVTDFSFAEEKNEVTVRFCVFTTQGEMQMERTVKLGNV